MAYDHPRRALLDELLRLHETQPCLHERCPDRPVAPSTVTATAAAAATAESATAAAPAAAAAAAAAALVVAVTVE